MEGKREGKRSKKRGIRMSRKGEGRRDKEEKKW